jgi:single-strand DNA-binding protein
MIRASIYGRLGRDPEQRQTRTGNPMATASLAVDVRRADGPDDIEWISLVAFGKVAEELARHSRGDGLAAMGLMTRSRFTGRVGEERAGWSLAVDAIVSARTVRSGAKRQQTARPDARPKSNGTAHLADDRLDDLWPDEPRQDDPPGPPR